MKAILFIALVASAHWPAPLEAQTYQVPIDIISFADDDGSRQATDQAFIQLVFDRMNAVQYNPHGMHLVIHSFQVLNHTVSNSGTTFDEMQSAKDYIYGIYNNTPTDGNTLTAFFSHDFTNNGSGLAWMGIGDPLDGSTVTASNITVSGLGTVDAVALTMAHEVGHTMGLLHLDQYANQALYGPGANPDNRMWGGTVFESWQADIMKDTPYVRLVPEPGPLGLACISLPAFWSLRRRRLALPAIP